MNSLSKTVLTSAAGEMTVAKNALHAWAMQRPFTFAVIAMLFGNVVGAVFRI